MENKLIGGLIIVLIGTFNIHAADPAPELDLVALINGDATLKPAKRYLALRQVENPAVFNEARRLFEAGYAGLEVAIPLAPAGLFAVDLNNLNTKVYNAGRDARVRVQALRAERLRQEAEDKLAAYEASLRGRLNRFFGK